jgi:hypothetical protein
VGGNGAANVGVIATLSNSGKIVGGNGAIGFGTTSRAGVGGGGGAGVANSGTIATLTSSGAISGGSGGGGAYVGSRGGAGGAGVSSSGAIVTLTVTGSGTLGGGNGAGGVSAGGLGGAGLSNSGTIVTLSSSGKILGGTGGDAQSGAGGAGGAGVANSGTIFALTNSGLIEGGKGGNGPKGRGARGDATDSAGAHASIGSIANTGRIVGNVVIDDQASVTVTGGSGKTFGRWTGGAITIGAGSLTFASGNTALGDDISVDGGAGTVINRGALRLTAPETIDGNFTQSKAGVLDLDFAGDVPGEYGALPVTKLMTLDGGLSIDLTKGFTLGAGETFDILGFASLSAISPASRSTAPLALQRSWTCGPVAEACV